MLSQHEIEQLKVVAESLKNVFENKAGVKPRKGFTWGGKVVEDDPGAPKGEREFKNGWWCEKDEEIEDLVLVDGVYQVES